MSRHIIVLFLRRNKRCSGELRTCFYCKLHCLIEVFGLCESARTFSRRRDLAYTTIELSSIPLRILRLLRAALLLFTYIRVYSRTSVVLLPRFLCFPTRYIIEVAFHPVHPIQPILARTCFFYATTRLTLAHYECSTFIRFLQTRPHIFYPHTSV